jgi:predicted GIY-YIG superfamily endonuclease
MPWVYILKGSSGRHDIGSALDLDARLARHMRGHTATTKRLGDTLEIVAKKEVLNLSLAEVRAAPNSESFREREHSGLVGSSILPLAF